MRITKVDIKDWRILHEPKAFFQSSCAVIIGENGSGKSTLIELIMSIFDAVYKRLKHPNASMELDGFCLGYTTNDDENEEHEVRFECGYDEGGLPGELHIFIDNNTCYLSEDGVERLKRVLPTNILTYYAGNTDRISRICKFFIDENVKAVRRIDNEFTLKPLRMPAGAPFIYSDLWHMPVALTCLLVSQQESKSIEKLNIREESATVVVKLKRPSWASKEARSEDFWGNRSQLFNDFLGGLIANGFNPEVKENSIEVEIGVLNLSDFLDEAEIEHKGVFLFQIFDLLYNNGLLDTVDVKWVRRDDEMDSAPISCQYFSEGEKQVIMTSALIEFWDKKHCLFLFDEPDTFLHPKWQSRFLPEVQDSLNESQAIITTHSPLMLSSVKQESELFVMKDGKIMQVNFSTYGMEASDIIEAAMETVPRDVESNSIMEEIEQEIDDENFESAQKKLEALKDIGINRFDMNRLQTTIDRIKLLGE